MMNGARLSCGSKVCPWLLLIASVLCCRSSAADEERGVISNLSRNAERIIELVARGAYAHKSFSISALPSYLGFHCQLRTN